MEFKNITCVQESGLAIITLNRPAALNAINNDLLSELEQAFSLLMNDSKMRVLIIAGNNKVFAAGADVNEMLNADSIAAYRHSCNVHRVFDRLETLPYPTIAAINGPALGGGCELALCCDFRIAGENSMFGLPEITLGIFPGAGGTQRLAKLVGPSRAKEIVFMGTTYKAFQALEMGLVNKVVSDGEVLSQAKEMAAKLMERPGLAMEFAKETINCGINKDLNIGKDYEKKLFALVFSSHDQKEGMKAFVEKRKPIFTNE